MGSLENRLLLGVAAHASNNTFPSGTRYSNVNVYSKFLSIDEMVSITNGSRCGEEGDYLSWSKSQWTLVGKESKILEVDESQLCPSKETKLFVNGPVNKNKADRFCQILGNSWLVVPKDFNHSARLLEYYSNNFLKPVGTGFENFQNGYKDFWMNVYDQTGENDWINANSKKPITFFEWRVGQPNSALQRCVSVNPSDSAVK